MTTHAPTLASWLKQQIAADEAAAHDRHLSTCITVDRDWMCDCALPARVLAECAAKRRIVELHDVAHYCSDGTLQQPITPPMFSGGDERYALCPTLRALATIYADAPGFREEWRA